MASGRTRSTRKLRSWMVEQVSSGRYPGLTWDDDSKTMFRIPWKHAGKQDFRSDEDAAIFKAWAEFKGKLSNSGHSDPASWKTRLRCALNKSTEFSEVVERSQLDISEPYKVYRLMPIAEQGLVNEVKKRSERATRRKRKTDDFVCEETLEAKQVKGEVALHEPISVTVEVIEEGSDVTFEEGSDVTFQDGEIGQSMVPLKTDETLDELQFNFTIETVPPSEDVSSFLISVLYLGHQVLQCHVKGNDVRIAYLPPSPFPPSLVTAGFPRIPLPEPPSDLTADPAFVARQEAFSTLLPVMEKGVVLTSTGSGVYAKRFCQGRVFWKGPHNGMPGPCKMERGVDPVLLFNRETFQRELDNFQSYGGDPPQCGITLCFGEELVDGDDLSSKLIVIKVTLPWAQQQVKKSQSFQNSIILLQSLASQSPLNEVTLNLVPVP